MFFFRIITNMATQPDVEKVINFLQSEKGITLADMMEKVGVERGGFLSWSIVYSFPT